MYVSSSVRYECKEAALLTVQLSNQKHQFLMVSHVFLFTFGAVHLEVEIRNFNWEILTSDFEWNTA